MDPTQINPKVSFGRTIVIHGDDWQARVFSSGSQPSLSERSYFILVEDAYGEEHLERLTEAELNERLVKATYPPHSVEELLRMANQDRTLKENSIPAPRKQITMKDI